MLYDVHTHIGCDLGFYLRNWWPYAATAQDLLNHMDAFGIGKAVCFPFCLATAFDPYAFASSGKIQLLAGRFPYDRENELLAEEVQRIDRDGRLLQFAMFDPSREVDRQVNSLATLVGCIKGLKTQTTVLESPIRSLLGDGRDLMHFAQQHQLPVLFHTSIYDEDPWAQTMDCLDVAEANPDVRFNLAHSLRYHRRSLERAARLPNVWVDCSAHLIHCRLARENLPAVAKPGERVDADYARPADVLRIVNDLCGGKSLWGSDNPFMSWCSDQIAMLSTYREEAEVLHALPPALREQIGTTNAEAWLFGSKRG